MEPIEDFMREFFKAHVDVELAKLAAYRAFRDRFFVDGYAPFDTAEFRRSCEAEKVVSTERSGSTALVTTSTPYWNLQLQFRYTLLRSLEQHWLRRSFSWAAREGAQIIVLGPWEHLARNAVQFPETLQLQAKQ